MNEDLRNEEKMETEVPIENVAPEENVPPETSPEQEFEYTHETQGNYYYEPQGNYYNPNYEQPTFSFHPEAREKKSNGDAPLGMGRLIAAGLIGAILGTVITAGGLFGITALSGRNPLETLLQNTNQTYSYVPSQKIDITNTASNPIRAVAMKSGPSVVGVNVTAVSRDTFFGDQQISGSGSGIIIRPDGYIMTNNHVVTEALDQNGVLMKDSKITVVLSNDIKEFPATLIGRDIRTDLAVLKIDATNLPTIEWGDSSKLQVGDQVVAIGNPGGMEFQGSVTAGVVSGINRSLSEDNQDVKLIQTDASINPGNSGGALFDSTGLLVGVNSSKIKDIAFEGIGFAIPSNVAKTISDALILKKYVPGRPSIGISYDPTKTKDFFAQNGWPEGVYVSEVTLGSAAEKAGMKIADIITKFDGTVIKSFTDLNNAKGLHKPGDTVQIDVYRDGKTITLTLVLDEEK